MGTQSLGEWIKELLNTYVEYLKPWVAVNSYQESIILRFGKYHSTLGPGYWPKLPFFEYSMDVNVKPDTMEIEAVTLTTLDGKSIAIGLMIDFEIIDSKKFMVDNNDSYTNMVDIARGEISDCLEEKNWADIKKKTTKNALMKLIQERYNKLGVKLNDLKFTDKCETRIFKLFGDGKKQLNAIGN